MAFNFGSESRPELGAVISKTPPFISLLLEHLPHPASRSKVEFLARIVSQILLIASKEHTATSLPLPLELSERPSLSDIFELAKQAQSSEELMDLLTIFLNPPLGLRIVSFKTEELRARCDELAFKPEAHIALIQSIIAASDGKYAYEDFMATEGVLLGEIDRIMAEKEQDTLLVSKLHEWSEHEDIRRRLVKDKAGIALY